MHNITWAVKKLYIEILNYGRIITKIHSEYYYGIQYYIISLSDWPYPKEDLISVQLWPREIKS